MRCELIPSDPYNLALSAHLKFLRAVGDSPNRLALYVLSYAQHALALDPKLRSACMASLVLHADAAH